jgi:UDP-N-acetylglucosamine--N-acetylmuramyl-(pentapeptide) pyrophosphoryl-undecaprenol N-acetylglucosamine transferase
VVLVTGASQGARSINQFMIQMVRAHPGAFAGWQVLHQTGPTDAEEAAQTYAGAGIPAIVEPFVHGLGVWWGASELAVGRCGAGVVAEAWASQTPAFFMPYPYHRDQHQRANASALASAGAALIVDDRVDSGPNVIANGSALLALLADAPRRGSMRAAYGGLGPVDGARQVAQVLAGLVPARD